MDIFISWSGARSQAVAEALRDWLPMVINAAKPFLSSEDIGKGARWSAELAAKLEKSTVGIICLTPGNMNSQWVLFEAGALSKLVGDTHVCPLLIGLKPSDVKGPLSQFQFTTTRKLDMLQLVKTLNTAASESGVPITQLEKVFEALWPQLEEQLKKAPVEESKGAPQRSEREMLEETLELVRNLSRPQRTEPLLAVEGLSLEGRVAYLQKYLSEIMRVLVAAPDELEAVRVEPFGTSEVRASLKTKSGVEVSLVASMRTSGGRLAQALVDALKRQRDVLSSAGL